MIRTGQHRLPRPVRLLTLAAALLVAAGVASGIGPASAHPDAAGHDAAGHDAAHPDAAGHGSDEAAPEVEEFPGRDEAGPPSPDDYVDIALVPADDAQPAPGPDASTGSFTSECGINDEGHRNSDNYMTSPGKVNGAQHVHDYVGNLSTDAFSADEALAEAGTTCADDDRSTYFWPVLRATDRPGADADADGGGLDGNVGEILQPSDVDLDFRGNPAGPVTAMPEFLMIITGDAKAVTNGDANVAAKWTCSGFEDATTTKYPLCPQGSDLIRILDFPSCWDGESLDSENHRTHVTFPDDAGACTEGTVAIPQLRMTLSYGAPSGTDFALDSFPDQRHAPQTDHADFENLMPESSMAAAVDCINRGKNC